MDLQGSSPEPASNELMWPFDDKKRPEHGSRTSSHAMKRYALRLTLFAAVFADELEEMALSFIHMHTMAGSSATQIEQLILNVSFLKVLAPC